MQKLDDTSLDILFRKARTHNAWLDIPIADELLVQVYELARMGATSVNSCPMRVVFVASKVAKEKLKLALDEGNWEKCLTAPVTAIIGQDLEFYIQLPKLFPHADAKMWFVGNEKLIEDTAFRNSSLQGAYLMLAARALGLDTGAISGFDHQKIDEMFFAGTSIKSNFLCNLGYGDANKLFPRLPRLEFSEACRIE